MMKKIVVTAVFMMVLCALLITSVSAYTLPKGMAVTVDEGVDFSEISATEVFGFVGDADLNQKLNIRDATLIQKASAKMAELSAEAQRLCDVDFSGAVNVRDATSIQKWLADIETEAPVYHALYATNDEAQIESVAGNWRGCVNIARNINAQLKAEGKDPGFEFECVEIDVLLNWNSDMTYSIRYDESTFGATFEQFIDNYEKGMTEYFEQYIKDNKSDTTVEAIIQASGFDSMRDFAESAVSEDMLRDFISFENTEGKYSVSEEVIYLSDNLTEEPSESMKISYEYFDVKFVITGGNSLVSEDLCPVSFERI